MCPKNATVLSIEKVLKCLRINDKEQIGQKKILYTFIYTYVHIFAYISLIRGSRMPSKSREIQLLFVPMSEF